VSTLDLTPDTGIDDSAPEVEAVSEPVGMVIGTEDSTPLEFWVGVSPDSYLQLDDAVVVQSDVPVRGPVRISGIVQNVRARHCLSRARRGP